MSIGIAWDNKTTGNFLSNSVQPDARIVNFIAKDDVYDKVNPLQRVRF